MKLVANAILEIRYYAAQADPGHSTQIHEIADVVHNLPGGILGGGERRPEPYGYHTFRYMWETASARQREWLRSQFGAIGYDYSYLDEPPSPPARKEVRRSASAKEIPTAVLVGLEADSFSAALELRHADPGAMHVLMPRERHEPRFRPEEPGVSEYNCLLRMVDGETILVHFRFPIALFDALPARRRTLRWTTPARDGYLWRRGHAADVCAICSGSVPPGADRPGEASE
ncbi:MAG: hypothetical protein HOV76_15115 [Hamadaea sp.]|nr:hypothetical protein [Hamadaea sp.]